MANLHVRRNPDALTARLANNGTFDGSEATWVEQTLYRLRDLKPGTSIEAGGFSLAELKQAYMSARVIQGSIVAGRLALATTLEAGDFVRSATLPDDFGSMIERASPQTERFLTGMENGVPRPGNDYPDVVKTYISALAGLLEAPYGRAYARLEEEHPQLIELGQDADELQRLIWAHMRWVIKDVISEDEIAEFRRDC